MLDCALGFDAQDRYSRPAPAGFGAYGAMPARFAVGVPRPDQREFFGNSGRGRGCSTRRSPGSRRSAATIVEVDFAPFVEAAALVYGGPWLVERRAAIDAAIGGRREMLHPVTRRVVAGERRRCRRRRCFAARSGSPLLAQQIAPVWRRIDLLLVPTTGTIYRIAEVEADPLALNATLGHYTNFANLLDLAAIAVPNGFQSNGLPAGVTLARAGLPRSAAGCGRRRVSAAERAAAGRHRGGAAGRRHDRRAAARYPYLPIAVVGAHLSGQPLNGELLALGARLRRAVRTAPDYRLYALADGRRPGLVRDPASGRRDRGRDLGCAGRRRRCLPRHHRAAARPRHDRARRRRRR